jgi:hypothetical protein
MAGEDEDEQFRRQEAALRVLWKRAKEVRRKYEKASTRLWIGNAGGAAVTIAYLGSTGAAARHPSFAPLIFFLLGLLCLGIAMLADLILGWLGLASNQWATSLLRLKIGFPESPLQHAGWSVRNGLAIAIAGAAFLMGCFAGILSLI